MPSVSQAKSWGSGLGIAKDSAPRTSSASSPTGDDGRQWHGGEDQLRYSAGGIDKFAGPILSERIRHGTPVFEPDSSPLDESRHHAFVEMAAAVLERLQARFTLGLCLLPETSPPARSAFRSPCIICGQRTVKLSSIAVHNRNRNDDGRLFNSFLFTVFAPARRSPRCCKLVPKLMDRVFFALIGRSGSSMTGICLTCRAYKHVSELQRCARCNLFAILGRPLFVRRRADGLGWHRRSRSDRLNDAIGQCIRSAGSSRGYTEQAADGES
ncbi:hypothetical protein DFJ74DRAFT_679721 [Hyaloraphidium curvatum]|nr:hypothetical protein DFJ74DRAFT_679721 [Hyaloraphidium curvatum]